MNVLIVFRFQEVLLHASHEEIHLGEDPGTQSCALSLQVMTGIEREVIVGEG